MRLHLLALLSLTACLDEEPLDDGLDPGTTIEARCTTDYDDPPPANQTVALDYNETRSLNVTPSGTSGCSNYVVELEPANEYRAVIKYGTVQPVFTQTTCRAQVIRVNAWYLNPVLGWIQLPTLTDRGTWITTTSTCLQPSVSYESPNYHDNVFDEDRRVVYTPLRVMVEAENNGSNHLPVKLTATYDTELAP